MKTDLSASYNPYDFANPVTNPLLFSGRSEELREIRYYLDEAAKAPRPMNLALLGPRASGETSLLNMIEIEGRERGFCVSRIELNESDVTSPLAFFFKVFDAALNAACEHSLPSSNDDAPLYPFGGITGKTYQTYIDMISTYDVSHDIQWCPFLFPVQYAKAQSASVDLDRCRVSDHILKRDLDVLRKECRRPLVLLFDECDCINANVILLEMLRNVFMNLPGYMLVFAGLPTLFPLMNEVFSPIIRQFKRVEVGAFLLPKDTRTCIEKPLESLGITPSKIFDVETLEDIQEIHDLSSGRPYEINLICHFLFKRVQQRKAANMKLNLGVLEDVRKELEKEQDISARPILAAIRNMRKDDLERLGFFSRCAGRATLDQLWCVQTVCGRPERWVRGELDDALASFVGDRILRVDQDSIIHFSGDDFDRIYAKYFAKENDVALRFDDLPPEVLAVLRWHSLFTRIAGVKPLSDHICIGDSEVDIAATASALGNVSLKNDVYVEDPPYLSNLLRLATDCRQQKTFPVVRVRLDTPTFTVTTYYVVTPSNGPESALSALTELLDVVAGRASSVNSGIAWEVLTVHFPSLEDVIGALQNTQNRNLRGFIAQDHAKEVVVHYCRDKDAECARHHANMARQLSDGLNSVMLNNIGYLFMKLGDLEQAEECLRLALGTAKAQDKSLILYNLSVTLLIRNSESEVQELIDEGLSIAHTDPASDIPVACLLYPELDDHGALAFHEKWDVSLTEALESLRTFIEGLPVTSTENTPT